MVLGFAQTLRANVGLVSRLGHNRFLPRPFWFIHYPTFDAVQCFTKLCHNFRRSFLRPFWMKNITSTWVGLSKLTDVWAAKLEMIWIGQTGQPPWFAFPACMCVCVCGGGGAQEGSHLWTQGGHTCTTVKRHFLLHQTCLCYFEHPNFGRCESCRCWYISFIRNNLKYYFLNGRSQ
jgi:hypothetical protein